MNGWNGLLACAVCLTVGVVFGIGFALARPGLLRRVAKKLGLPDGNQRWFYEQTVAFHRRMDDCVPDQAVLFIGDSFIQGLCVTEVAAKSINYGIGGDTTEGLLARLPHYPSLNRARAVVVSVGENDLRKGRTPADINLSYGRILARLPEKSFRVFLFPDALHKSNGQPVERCGSEFESHRSTTLRVASELSFCGFE